MNGCCGDEWKHREWGSMVMIWLTRMMIDDVVAVVASVVSCDKK